MCYMIVLSTNSDRNLADLNSDFVVFSKVLPATSKTAFLKFEHQWYLGSKDGCSCGFRHLDRQNVALGFCDPQDWYPEESDDIAATVEAFTVLKSIATEGVELDCIDVWTSDEDDDGPLAGEMTVNLATLSSTSFRFFEGHRSLLLNA